MLLLVKTTYVIGKWVKFFLKKKKHLSNGNDGYFFFPQEMGSADIAGKKKRWMGEDTALRARTEKKKM